ncbi:hypothetical protein [Anaeromyxobacter oryzae]|uniref:Uncharacterized protein n=1 Tax=Anaeromyxobacter oryzae TaxID=2918170 RepID=A0ABN6MSM5_9BACT|nr:hypothetical protein [Anaeromyxobacter oryzae]BDG02625.1 hypothetical protein AMOR_16210 [Anaeromyxobacter oryzae]
MMRTIDDVVELRRWAEMRGARPCRDASTGRLVLALAGDVCDVCDVDWGEWETTFVLWRCAFVYDDAPGAARYFIGPAEEAHAYVERELAASCARHP